MARRIAYHLDEHVTTAVAEGLRRRGIGVTTTHEAGLRGSTDVHHLDYAHTHGRVLLTRDADHLRLNRRGHPHSGIAFWRQNTRTVGAVIKALVHLWESKSAEDMIGRVHFL